MSSLPHGHREFLKYFYWSTFTKSPKIIYFGALAPDSVPSITHPISPNVFAFRARCKVHLFIQVYTSGMNARPWLLVCLYKEGRVWIYKLPYEFTPCWLLPACVLLHAVEEATSYKGTLSVPSQCPQGVSVQNHFTEHNVISYLSLLLVTYLYRQTLVLWICLISGKHWSTVKTVPVKLQQEKGCTKEGIASQIKKLYFLWLYVYLGVHMYVPLLGVKFICLPNKFYLRINSSGLHT